MVSCAFATTGTIEMANVRLINPDLIEVVLDAGFPENGCRHERFLSESLDNFYLNVWPSLFYVEIKKRAALIDYTAQQTHVRQRA